MMYGGLAHAPVVGAIYNKFDYQDILISDIRREMALGSQGVAVQSPTGSGKSFVVVSLARSVLAKGGQFRYIAPRKQLVRDVAGKMDEAGILHSVHMHDAPRWYGRRPNVQLWCIKSFLNYVKACEPKDDMLKANHRMQHVNLFAFDEAHINQESILKVVRKYPASRSIFLTATPLPGMDRFFPYGRPALIHGPSVKMLTERGVLVPARYKTFEPDNIEAEYLRGEIVETWLREGEDRPTVVFCKGRREAKHIHERFLSRGVAAEYMDALTPGDEREEIFYRIECGESRVLVNVKVMEYGVDKPFFSCAVLAYVLEARLEDTVQKLAGYIQRAGRVLRACEGKEDALIIDHTGIVNMFRRLDEERQWEISSEGLRDMAERERKSVEEEREAKAIQCRKCGHEFIQLSHCPRCGEVVHHQATEEVEHIEAHIGEIDLDTGQLKRWDKARSDRAYAEILWCVRAKGKKDGMAFHVHQRLNTGCKAPWSGSVTPVEPQESMKLWAFDIIRKKTAQAHIIRNSVNRKKVATAA